jgi:hypothetical protein
MEKIGINDEAKTDCIDGRSGARFPNPSMCTNEG